jgi:hypothetical protein
VATLGLGLVSLIILIWFLWPLFTGSNQPPRPATNAGNAVLVTPTPPSNGSGASGGAPSTAQPETQGSFVPADATLPSRVETGIYARVAGTGSDGLSFRSGPGMDYVRWQILKDGDILKITGGPSEDDGVIWWRAVTKTGLVGWAAEQWLVPVDPPAWTPEPERTPLPEELFTPTPAESPTPTPESEGSASSGGSA